MQRFNGSYSVNYKGVFGAGVGQMHINEGNITGTDFTGAQYAGTGKLENDQLKVNVIINHSGAPGTYNVMTGQQGPIAVELSFALPEDFLDHEEIQATTTLGPLTLGITKA